MDTPRNVPEEFLQFVWENRLFHHDFIQTTEGKLIEIISPGKRNTNSGPDFFNAKIKIEDTVWAGNVEIHKKASDWQKHGHDKDKAYENVVLHVVEAIDYQTTRQKGEIIPTLIITYPEQYKKNYEKLLEAKTWIPCEEQFFKVDPVMLRLGFNRLMIDRLEEKTGEITRRLSKNKGNWNETFYQILARSFGFKVNAIPFEMLARAVPLQILAKHKNILFQLEALLFGSSGLLNEELIGDDYYLNLREEYSFLYKKYKIKPVEGHLWKFMRLRPANFPTIRISQMAALIHHSQGLFSKIIEIDSIEELKNLFRVKASSYWNSHYRFNKKSKKEKPHVLGETSVNILIINVVVPFLFVYGENRNMQQLKNRALEFLEKLPPESNSVIRNWQNLGVETRSAFETQALLQLKNSYCEKKKCLNCQIGNKIVKTIPESTL